MGAEIKCRVRFSGKTSGGRALLETNEIIFRGDFRLKIPLKQINGVKAARGELRINLPEGEAVFELGAAAEKWAEKILHPKSVMEKIGVKDGSKAVVVNINDEDFLTQLKGRAVCSRKVVPRSETIFFGAESAVSLKRVPTFARALAPAGALWIVYPKGQTAIREIDVIGAGRRAGLKDVKVVGFSATHTALKFVIPLAKR
ncbi:MAG TPA: hypothetical protein VKR82_00105 [Candidatus Acidoferrales bacterium]|nr:hypothetical protein [Candidatus Acidoferrales bacterium]